MVTPPSIVYVAERVPRFAYENSPYTAKDVAVIRKSQHAEHHTKQGKLTRKLKGNCISCCCASMRTISKRKSRWDMSWDEFIRRSCPGTRIMNGGIFVIDDNLFSCQRSVLTHSDRRVIERCSVHALHFDGMRTLRQYWGLIPLEVRRGCEVHVRCAVLRATVDADVNCL